MNRTNALWILCAILVTTSLISCGRTQTENTATLDAVTPDAPTFVASRDVVPRAGETYTAAAARALEEYGTRLLAHHAGEARAQIERSGEKESAPLTQYTITLLGFYESKASFIVPDYDLYYSQNLNAMKRQVEEGALFLRDFHLYLGGSAFPPFSRLVLEPSSNVTWAFKSATIVRGTDLVIRVAGGDYWYTSANLLNFWASGDHLGGTSLTRSAYVSAGWKLFDPAGAVQRQVRQAVRRSGGDLSTILASFGARHTASDLETAKADLLGIAEQSTNTAYKTPDEKSLRDALAAKLTKATTAEQVIRLAKAWKDKLDDGETTTNVQEAYTALWREQDAVERSTEVKVIFAPIFIGNDHDIRVRFVGRDVVTKDPQLMYDRIQAERVSERNRYSVLISLIALKFDDQIDVSVNLTGVHLLGLQSVSLDRAIRFTIF